MSKTAQALESIFTFSTTVIPLADFDYDEPVDVGFTSEPLFYNVQHGPKRKTSRSENVGAQNDQDAHVVQVENSDAVGQCSDRHAVHDNRNGHDSSNEAASPNMHSLDDEHQKDMPVALKRSRRQPVIAKASVVASKQRKKAAFYDDSDDADDDYKIGVDSKLAELADDESDDLAQKPYELSEGLHTEADDLPLGADATGRQIDTIDALLKDFEDNRLAVDAGDDEYDVDFEAFRASGGRKAHRPKKGAARKTKTIAEEKLRAKFEMQAETQRIEREMAVYLPCHEPQNIDLDSFLAADAGEEITTIVLPALRANAQISANVSGAKLSTFEYRRQIKARIRDWHEKLMSTHGPAENIQQESDEEDEEEEQEETEKLGNETEPDEKVLPADPGENTDTIAAVEQPIHTPSASADDDEQTEKPVMPSEKQVASSVKQFIDVEAEDDAGNEDEEAENDAEEDDGDSFINDEEEADNSDSEPFVFPPVLKANTDNAEAADADNMPDGISAIKDDDDDAPVKRPFVSKRARLHKAFEDDDDEDDVDVDSCEEELDEDDADDLTDAENLIADAVDGSDDRINKIITADNESDADDDDAENAEVDETDPDRPNLISKTARGFIDDEAELSDADNYEAGSDDERDDDGMTEEERKELQAMYDPDFDMPNDEIRAGILPLVKKQEEQRDRNLLRKIRDKYVEDEDLTLTKEEDLAARRLRAFKWTTLLGDENVDVALPSSMRARGAARGLSSTADNNNNSVSIIEDEDARIEDDIKAARERFEQRRHASNGIADSMRSSEHGPAARRGLHRPSRFTDAAGFDAPKSPLSSKNTRRNRNNFINDADDEEEECLDGDEHAADLRANELERRFNDVGQHKIQIDAALRCRRSTATSLLTLYNNNNKLISNNKPASAGEKLVVSKQTHAKAQEKLMPRANVVDFQLLNTPERSEKHLRGSWLARNTNSLRRLHSVKFADAPNYELGLFQHISPKRLPTSPAVSNGRKRVRETTAAAPVPDTGVISSIPKTPASMHKRARLLMTPAAGGRKKLQFPSPRTPGQQSIVKLLMSKQKSGLDEFFTP